MNREESFKEWFSSKFPTAYRRNPEELRSKAAWGHQQEKIDVLEEQLAEKDKEIRVLKRYELMLEATKDQNEGEIKDLERDIKGLESSYLKIHKQLSETQCTLGEERAVLNEALLKLESAISYINGNHQMTSWHNGKEEMYECIETCSSCEWLKQNVGEK